MKRITAALFLASLVFLAACSSGGEPGVSGGGIPTTKAPAPTQKATIQPETEPPETEPPETEPPETEPPAQDGWARYANEEYGIALLYPETWLEMSAATLNDPALPDTATDFTQMTKQELEAQLDYVLVYFYNTDAATLTFAPNLNIVASPGLLTRSMLEEDGFTDEVKLQVETQYSSLIGEFEWLDSPRIAELGGNTYVMYTTAFSMGDLDIASYQALTSSGGNIYNFTYSTLSENLIQGERDIMERLLASVELS